jgi:hypothetical protein
MSSKDTEHSLVIGLGSLVKFKNQILILKTWLVITLHTEHAFSNTFSKTVKSMVEPVYT